MAVFRCERCGWVGDMWRVVRRGRESLCPSCSSLDLGLIPEPARAPEFPNTEPLARREDLSTSKESAEALTESGRRDQDKWILLRAVVGSPGRTAQEYAAMLPGQGMDSSGSKASRRLPDLMSDGYVYQGPVKVNPATNRKCVTWYPTRLGQESAR